MIISLQKNYEIDPFLPELLEIKESLNLSGWEA